MARPSKTCGRVYCGYSSSPSAKLSSAAEASLPMTPGSSRTQASSSASAAISPPESTKSPSETSSSAARLDHALVDALKAAADDDRAGAGASSAHAALRQRRAARAHQQARRASSCGTASSARASTSAFITMPGPPPAGVSSTVRCLSVACARMSTVSSDQMPAASALPARLCAERPRKHLRKDRQHARAPHGSLQSPRLGLNAVARRTILPALNDRPSGTPSPR